MKIEKLLQILPSSTAFSAVVDPETTANSAVVGPELRQKLPLFGHFSQPNYGKNCRPFNNYQGGWGIQGPAVAAAPAMLGRSGARRPVENEIGPIAERENPMGSAWVSRPTILCACCDPLRYLGPACGSVAQIGLRDPGAFCAAWVNVPDQRYLGRITDRSLSTHAGKPFAKPREGSGGVPERFRFRDACAAGRTCHAPVRVSAAPARVQHAQGTRQRRPFVGPPKPLAPGMPTACAEHQTSTGQAPCSTVAHRGQGDTDPAGVAELGLTRAGGVSCHLVFWKRLRTGHKRILLLPRIGTRKTVACRAVDTPCTCHLATGAPRQPHRCASRTPERGSPRTAFTPSTSRILGYPQNSILRFAVGSVGCADCQSRQSPGRASTEQKRTGGGGPANPTSCRGPGVRCPVVVPHPWEEPTRP